MNIFSSQIGFVKKSSQKIPLLSARAAWSNLLAFYQKTKAPFAGGFVGVF